MIKVKRNESLSSYIVLESLFIGIYIMYNILK